ncbi:MAG TPA: aminotransferase class III-fold pyridoxal phosphate-dependent enzyme [Candidatus Polarisedimenticolia bacterium]|jgi:glutamate-1-semialdehyde aminotransferase|nr:aminotransferase class III-fold pyridoxal phosphate-dependent enzyme [Candidatus Polarisedimenticolia bacterium]
MPAPGVDPAKVARVRDQELKKLVDARPRTMALIERARACMPNGVPMVWMATDNEVPVYVDRGEGAAFTDVDGHRYLDVNVADMSMFCGYAHPAIVDAVALRARAGTQFLLPSPEAVEVAEELAGRYPVPFWQFTLSASQANVEAIRVARAATGREVALLFDGHYHGHFDEGLIDLQDGRLVPAQRGLVKATSGKVRIAQFNDTDGLRRALEPRDVAIVLTEPALTNNVHLLMPRPGWHEALRALTRETGTVLAIDETHTHVVGPGGATGWFHLEPDIVTIGKSIAGGVPLGAYGLIEPLAAEIDIKRKGFAATGGTLFGNPLSMAASRAALKQVLTPAAYEHTASLGARLAEGIDTAIRDARLPWTAQRFGPRSGHWYGPEPQTGQQALALRDTLLTGTQRIWMANRGVWEALPGAGPTMAVPSGTADVDRYLDAYGSFLRAVAG